MTKCKSYRKTKSPKCGEQKGCEWIVGSGCLDEGYDISTEYNNPKKECKSYRKTKKPKCGEQKGCEWITGSGCLDEGYDISTAYNNPKKGCNSYRKTKKPKCNEQKGCEWMVGVGCLDADEDEEDEEDEKKEDYPSIEVIRGGDCIQRSKVDYHNHQLAAIRHLQRHRSLLVVFETGLGKTLTALTSSQCYLDEHPDNKVVVISPKSVVNNFAKEMVKYGDEIDSRYTFYSYDKFMLDYKKKKLSNCNHTMLIVDEVHNLRNYKGKGGGFSNRFEPIYRCSQQAAKVVLLTATPFVNVFEDVHALILLLRTGENPSTLKTLRTIDQTIDTLTGYTIVMREKALDSYAASEEFYVTVPMTPQHYKRYVNVITDQEDRQLLTGNPRVFYNAHRQAVNMVADSYFTSKLKKIGELLRQNKGKSLIYTNWLQFGVNPVNRFLENLNVTTEVISGDVNQRTRDRAVLRFNNDEIDVLVITNAGAEGIDLKGTRNIFILDPPWNPAGIHQVVGRGIRYKAHDHLPENERVVRVFYMVQTKPSGADYERYPDRSGDVLLYSIIDRKQRSEDEFYQKLTRISIPTA